ncbi:MAG: hypothetical protein GF335_02925 [Candidatus Moranbacteria bacterium]|nr:hypothetical protein [Candidatus Moranbacteria bacterium]
MKINKSNKRIAKFVDLKDIKTLDNKENLVPVNKYTDLILSGYFNNLDDMSLFFNTQILVRETVARKLAKAARKLEKIDNNLSLYITYGFRFQKIQKKYFYQELEKNGKIKEETDLIEKIHEKYAHPIVAGHPTGGAVDLTIYDKNKDCFLDMGGEIYDFIVSNTFSKKISKKQLKNRLLLHDLLVDQGFCPFYKEWWHFSYGDKEWAWFYNKKKAIYDQIKSFNSLKA